MLCLSDFVAGKKRFYNLSRGLCISASNHCRKMKLVVAGLVVRHGDLSHEMTLSHEGHRPECDNVNRV